MFLSRRIGYAGSDCSTPVRNATIGQELTISSPLKIGGQAFIRFTVNCTHQDLHIEVLSSNI